MLLLLLLLPAFAFADTFVVTSNADDGPGTLRDALQQAENNGTAVRDSIVFNLPAAVQDRTITITIGLVLSSNLVIDGSSEPANPFGVSDARVILTTPGACWAAFNMYKTTDIAIYGLWMKGFNAVNGPISSCFGGAISIAGCQNFILGKPGKGNVFSNNFFNVVTNGAYVVHDSTQSVNITVQSNFFDLDTLGENVPTRGGSSFGPIRNILIGGKKPEEGNYFGGNGLSVGDVYNGPATNNGFAYFMNNTVGMNYAKTKYESQCSISIEGSYNTNSDIEVVVSNNKFGPDSSYSPLRIQNISNNITINNNVFGYKNYSSSDPGKWGHVAIIISSCIKKDSIAIFQNIISGYTEGIESDATLGITCKNNKIYCTQKGIRYLRYPNVPVISIQQVSGVKVSGKTIPKGKVQIFTTDSCSEFCENGQKLLADVVADNAGNFSYNGVISGLVTALVTDNFGTTSEFNGVKVDTLYAYAKNATCGYNNGNITGVKIYNASSWYWQDSNGNKISTDTNLTNLAPGKYRIILFEPNVNCNVISGYFNILKEDRPKPDSSFNLTQPSCGQPTGAIYYTSQDSANTYNQWLDSLGHVIGSYQPDITNLLPGKYYYRSLLFDDSACYSTKGPLILINQAGASLKTNSVKVTNASCGKANGSIQNITYQNASGNVFIAWVDSLGNTVGNAINLLNVPAGKYLMKFKDSGGCDTIKTSYYTVGSNGVISFDTSKMTILPASCKGTDGSITGITSTNATVFKWVNTSTAASAGNNENIAKIPAGEYILFFSNAYGCTANTDTIVVSEKVLTIDTTAKQVKPSSCKGADGSITGITSTNATIFRWVNTASGDTVGRAVNINNIPAGVYQLTVSNIYGCQVQIGDINVGQSGFMQTAVTNATVTNAYCNLSNGSITIQQFTRDASLYTFQWIDSTTNTIISGSTSVQNLPPGIYVLYATDTNTCRQRIYSTAIKQLGKPQFDYSKLRLVSDTCNLHIGDVLFNSQNAEGYAWAGYNIAGQPQSTSPLGIISVGAGQYYATITDKYNCTATSDTFTINNYDISPAAPQAAGQYVLRGMQATLQVSNVQPGKYNLYDTVNATIPVNTSEAGILLTPPVYYDKLFYIQYLRGDCASPLQPVWVKVYDSTIISVPNAFSPNGDGTNDVWRLKVQGMVNNYTLTVFNRYGQVVYTSRDINTPWDGTMNGKPLQVGTYYYIIQATDNNNRAVKQSGYVMLLK